METQFYIAATLWIMLLLNRIIILGDQNEKKNYLKSLKEEKNL